MIIPFRDLEVYKESYSLMLIIHKEIFKFPQFEKNDLVSQLRRSTKSIPANIAEGWAKRSHEKEFKKHLDITLGSTNEIEVHLEIAKDLRYLQKDLCDNLVRRYRFLGGKISNLKRNWRTF